MGIRVLRRKTSHWGELKKGAEAQFPTEECTSNNENKQHPGDTRTREPQEKTSAESVPTGEKGGD
jgi:hypothetical protein